MIRDKNVSSTPYSNDTENMNYNYSMYILYVHRQTVSNLPTICIYVHVICYFYDFCIPVCHANTV